MRLHTKTLMWYLTSYHDLKPTIVDIGSRCSPNQTDADLRPFFGSKEYIGCDIIAGMGVDQIEDVEKLTFDDNSISTILCLDTLEHVANPILAMSEISRVIKDDGIVVVVSHMYAPVHYDPDYWRFTPKCFNDILFKSFINKTIICAGFQQFPEFLIGIGSVDNTIPLKLNLAEMNSLLPWSYPFRFEIISDFGMIVV